MGGHVLQRASVDGGLKPYVSAQRGLYKHYHRHHYAKILAALVRPTGPPALDPAPKLCGNQQRDQAARRVLGAPLHDVAELADALVGPLCWRRGKPRPADKLRARIMQADNTMNKLPICRSCVHTLVSNDTSVKNPTKIYSKHTAMLYGPSCVLTTVVQVPVRPLVSTEAFAHRLTPMY